MTLYHIGYVDVSKTLFLLGTNGVTCGCQHRYGDCLRNPKI
jgi:hypothetical protein